MSKSHKEDCTRPSYCLALGLPAFEPSFEITTKSAHDRGAAWLRTDLPSGLPLACLSAYLELKRRIAQKRGAACTNGTARRRALLPQGSIWGRNTVYTGETRQIVAPLAAAVQQQLHSCGTAEVQQRYSGDAVVVCTDRCAQRVTTDHCTAKLPPASTQLKALGSMHNCGDRPLRCIWQCTEDTRIGLQRRWGLESADL